MTVQPPRPVPDLSKMPALNKSSLALIAIGIFKLVKSSLLLALGLALIRWQDHAVGNAASDWIDSLWIGRPYFDSLLAKLSLISERTIKEFAVGSFVASALFLVEGVGLCLRKRWAEFMTVAITGSFLPFEFYELSRRTTLTGIVITLLNVAIVWYLVVRLMKDRRRDRVGAAV